MAAAETVREMFADGSVRDLRKARGWPLRVLAEQAGVTAATWCRWETGARQPDGDYAAGLLPVISAMRKAGSSG
jgi:transcriptional regulator with XRE-family HTH domain